ncbi:uncharacterized protein LOC126999397 [Eriocheir sinensis]|uniref:uncharacterized protein LOC126999397 n=1 Tax=Eriocheir sinensis TaxID=95602 RepID=UPI0021C82EF5|nr:uncharacterized protein LOC126999397 [Eriocheir sinensis]
MINTLVHACAVPLTLDEAQLGSGRHLCPMCRLQQVNALDMELPSSPSSPADMSLPDVITSNTPPATPTHSGHFFPTDEPWPDHTSAPAAPRWYLNLPQVCWDALFPLKMQGGASGEPENTCLTWTRVGRDLRRIADIFQSRATRDLEEQHQQDAEAVAGVLATAATIAKGFCVPLLCLAAWKILFGHKEVIQK